MAYKLLGHAKKIETDFVSDRRHARCTIVINFSCSES